MKVKLLKPIGEHDTGSVLETTDVVGKMWIRHDLAEEMKKKAAEARRKETTAAKTSVETRDLFE